ncbi:hypothetical protein Nepgr_001318 [Nepenthes gracilis]|uniref:Uncharacterized protein n=1 Tax=Nepenthes gracilis TaxID=150966 RepID=A0AAD3RWW7_NEPGR|nr:hypothetical protein Nepgr_001318 [Nepenthes gracilis]
MSSISEEHDTSFLGNQNQTTSGNISTTNVLLFNRVVSNLAPKQNCNQRQSEEVLPLLACNGESGGPLEADFDGVSPVRMGSSLSEMVLGISDQPIILKQRTIAPRNCCFSSRTRSLSSVHNRRGLRATSYMSRKWCTDAIAETEIKFTAFWDFASSSPTLAAVEET